MMPTIYCETWSDLIHEPDEPLTEAAAAARHERGELYTVVEIEDGKDIPTIAVEVRLEVGHARIYWFDDLGNKSRTATFKRHGDRMFMEQATFYEYAEPRFQPYEKAAVITHLILEPDGTGTEYVTTGGEKTGRSLSLEDGKSMDGFWAPVPPFGEYDGIGSVGAGAGI